MLRRPLNIASFSGMIYRVSRAQKNAYIVSDKTLSLLSEAVTLIPGNSLHVFVLGDLQMYLHDPFVYIDSDVIASGLMLLQQDNCSITRGTHLILSLQEVATDVQSRKNMMEEADPLFIYEFVLAVVLATGTTSDSKEAQHTFTGRTGIYTTIPVYKKLIVCHTHNRQLSIDLLGHLMVFAPESPSAENTAIQKALTLLASRTFDLDDLSPLKNYTNEDAAELAGILSEIIVTHTPYAWYLALFSLMHCFLMSPMPPTKIMFELAFVQHRISGLTAYHEKQIQLAVTFLSSLYSTVLYSFFANLALDMGLSGYPYQTGVMAQFYRACSYLHFNKMVSTDILTHISNIGRYLILDSGLVAREAISRLDLYPLHREIDFATPTEPDLVHIYLLCYQIAYENEHCRPAEFFDEIVLHNFEVKDLSEAILYPIAAFPTNEQVCRSFLSHLADGLAAACVEGSEALIATLSSAKLQRINCLPHMSMFADTCAKVIELELSKPTIDERFVHIYHGCAELVAKGIGLRASLLILLLSHAGPAVHEERLIGSAAQWLQTTCPNLEQGYSPLVTYILFNEEKSSVHGEHFPNSFKHVLAIYAYRILNNKEFSLQNRHMAAFIALKYMIHYEPFITHPPDFLENMKFYPIFRKVVLNELVDKSAEHFVFRPKQCDYNNADYYSDQNAIFGAWCLESRAIIRETETISTLIAERASWTYAQYDGSIKGEMVIETRERHENTEEEDSPSAAFHVAQGSENVSDGDADEEFCAVCLQALCRTTIIALGCKHHFCAECVARLILRSGRCALCRQTVTQLRCDNETVGLPSERIYCRHLMLRDHRKTALDLRDDVLECVDDLVLCLLALCLLAVDLLLDGADLRGDVLELLVDALLDELRVCEGLCRGGADGPLAGDRLLLDGSGDAGEALCDFLVELVIHLLPLGVLRGDACLEVVQALEGLLPEGCDGVVVDGDLVLEVRLDVIERVAHLSERLAEVCGHGVDLLLDRQVHVVGRLLDFLADVLERGLALPRLCLDESVEVRDGVLDHLHTRVVVDAADLDLVLHLVVEPADALIHVAELDCRLSRAAGEVIGLVHRLGERTGGSEHRHPFIFLTSGSNFCAQK